MTRIVLTYGHPRPEERLLRDAAEDRGLDLDLVQDARLVLDVHEEPAWLDGVDGVLNRCLSLGRGVAVAAHAERWGVRCINSAETLSICGDKWRTSLALARRGVPTPRTRLAFRSGEALDAAEVIGYPVVTKPLTGSWARLVARSRDAEALEALLEHKETLGHAAHGLHYLQEHVEKPGRDIRAFVVGDEVICAIHRTADHWITNTARGATASACEVTKPLAHVALEAAHAVGGGVLAVDLMETLEGELVVHEVNGTMEFRNSIEPTGVDIPDRILDHVLEVVA